MKHPALELLEALIRIPSVNPSYGEGAEGEAELSRFVERYFDGRGLAVTRQRVFEGRDNVVVELRTGHPEAALLFEAHMDTVSLGTMKRALEPTYRDGRLYGRGACDTKGSLAAMMYALAECAKRPELLSCDVILCASVDEEHRFRGVLRYLEDRPSVAAAVVGEPTKLRIVAAHKGCVRFAVHTHGKAAHSSVPEEGDNAIVRMAEVIRFLNERLAPPLAEKVDPLCGPATLSIGTIRGGKQINIVPDRCTIEVDRRIVPGENPHRVYEDIAAAFEEAFAREPDSYSIEPLLLDWALDTPPGGAFVSFARDAASRLGFDAGVYGETYGSDASKLQGIGGIPSIVYGPGSIAQAHSSEEWVAADEVERAARFYLELARGFGNTFSG